MARIRMLSQQMRGMKDKELKKALAEIDETGKKLALEGIEQFTTLTVAEGLSNRGEYKQAIDNLITYYQKNPGNQDIFKSRILRNIANELKDEVEKGHFMKALEFYSKYAAIGLKDPTASTFRSSWVALTKTRGAFGEARRIYQDALEIVSVSWARPKSAKRKCRSICPRFLRLICDWPQFTIRSVITLELTTGSKL